MLQTLGVRPVKGKTTLHPVLGEALENQVLDRDKLKTIIESVEAGSLIRVVSE